MLREVEKFAKSIFSSAELKEQKANKKLPSINKVTLLKQSPTLILGIQDNKIILISQGLETVLSQNKIKRDNISVRKDYCITTELVFVKNPLFSIGKQHFFSLTTLNLNKNNAYIVLDENRNVLFYNNLLNQYVPIENQNEKALTDLLTPESIALINDPENEHPEILFQSHTDNTFIISKTDRIGSLLCLHLFDITNFKSLEMHMAHSQKMQAIGQLAGGISHDFNNLLTAILGFCDLLLVKHPAGDPSFAEIMQIKQNSNRAANLVRQLLALSRKQVLKPKTIDISEVLAELANLVRRLIGENIDLDIIHGLNLKPIKVDQGQLEQVIINLVVNARDAIQKTTHKGKISIDTSSVKITSNQDINKDFICPEREKITPGEYILISVSDNGIGMPEDVISKIFEPFFSTKAIGAGTGLGLSTVFSIIKQTGGILYVSSKEGKGTTFHVYIKAELNTNAQKEQPTELSLVTKDLTGNATILLVEDEIPVRMFCAHALTNKGYKVIEATSGEEALEIFNKDKEQINLIISDVIMPGINGPTLIAEIRKTHPNVKVIFMSGYAEEAFSDGNKDNADFHFLSKPFTLSQLAEKVKDLLNEKETV